jgi:hypothetical protein
VAYYEALSYHEPRGYEENHEYLTEFETASRPNCPVTVKYGRESPRDQEPRMTALASTKSNLSDRQ